MWLPELEDMSTVASVSMYQLLDGGCDFIVLKLLTRPEESYDDTRAACAEKGPG